MNSQYTPMQQSKYSKGIKHVVAAFLGKNNYWHSQQL